MCIGCIWMCMACIWVEEDLRGCAWLAFELGRTSVDAHGVHLDVHGGPCVLEMPAGSARCWGV